MAIAAPARRSDLQTAPHAPQPARTEPPEPKKRPRDRPRPGGQGRSSATASVATPAPPKRKSGTTKRKAAPTRRKGAGGGRKTPAGDSPIRRTKSSLRASAASAVPARKAPARKVAPRRRPAGVIPIAAGAAARSAVAVIHLPESGLIHRLTRGRAWIGLLGVLLVGIVALNVVTLSFAASAGKIDARNQELAKENTMLQGRYAQKYGQLKITSEAKKLGLSASTAVNPKLLDASKEDVAKAAARLSAAAPAAGAATSGGEAANEGSAGEEAASGEAAATGGAAAGGEEAAAGGGETGGGGEETALEEAATAEAAEKGFTAEEQQIYEKEYAELVASEGGG